VVHASQTGSFLVPVPSRVREKSAGVRGEGTAAIMLSGLLDGAGALNSVA
jgi:hypothetical protein